MTQPARIQHIDAWRCIAVLMVIVHHVVSYSHPWYHDHLPAALFDRSWRFGHLGVLVFFCMSGYVICRGLIRERATRGAVSIKDFYVRRTFRILPPLALYMLALLALSAIGAIEIDATQFARAGLFACNLDQAKCGWHLGHTWSLAFEEQFYLVFPFLFVLSASLGGRRSVVALTIGLMCIALIAGRTGHERVWECAAVFGYMLTGCAAAMYWDELAPRLSAMPLWVWCTLLIAGPTLELVDGLPFIAEHIVKVVIMPLLICVVVFGTPMSNRVVARVFLNPTLGHVGKVSFTIYLWQQLATFGHPDASPLHAPAALAGVLLFALASYKYFELPLMRFAKAAPQAPAIPEAKLEVNA